MAERLFADQAIWQLLAPERGADGLPTPSGMSDELRGQTCIAATWLPACPEITR